MALARIKTWTLGEILTAGDLNSEFNNILNNPISLISPATADIAMGGFRLTGVSGGSVSSPGIQATGDSNTGIYFSAADTLDISAGGTRAVTITATRMRFPYFAVKATLDAIQTFTTEVEAAVGFNTEEFDSSTMHDLVTDNTKIVVPITGKYLVTTYVEWENNSTGIRKATLKKNGATTLRVHRVNAVNGDATSQHFTEPYSLTAADSLEILPYQNSGGNLSITTGTFLAMTYIGE